MKVQIRALRYGTSGSGKTQMIATFPLKENQWAFVYDFDDGINTIRNPFTGRLPKGFYAERFIDTAPRELSIKQWQRQARAMVDAKKLLDKMMRATEDKDVAEEIKDILEVKEEDMLPTYIAIDTLTGLHDVAGNLALTLDPKYGLGGSLAQHHYAAQMHYVREFVKLAESGPWHIDITCHEQVKYDEAAGTNRGEILVTGNKTPGLIPGWFDELYHHEISMSGRGNRYMLRTRSSGLFSAKSRLGGDFHTHIFDELEDVTLDGNAPYGWAKLIQKLETYWEGKE